jgi:hypothetical protein
MCDLESGIREAAPDRQARNSLFERRSEAAGESMTNAVSVGAAAHAL